MDFHLMPQSSAQWSFYAAEHTLPTVSRVLEIQR